MTESRGIASYGRSEIRRIGERHQRVQTVVAALELDQY
jgi:hypothetical protein